MLMNILLANFAKLFFITKKFWPIHCKQEPILHSAVLVGVWGSRYQTNQLLAHITYWQPELWNGQPRELTQRVFSSAQAPCSAAVKPTTLNNSKVEMNEKKCFMSLNNSWGYVLSVSALAFQVSLLSQPESVSSPSCFLLATVCSERGRSGSVHTVASGGLCCLWNYFQLVIGLLSTCIEFCSLICV